MSSAPSSASADPVSAALGIAASHVLEAIVGVGAVNRPGSVRWGIATRIIWAWVFTIPASALFSVLMYYVLSFMSL